VDFTEAVARAYEKVAFYRKNIFRTPSGRTGKMFVLEKAYLYGCVTEGNPLEGIALKAVAIMEHLLLQKPANSNSAHHKITLARRLDLWRRGAIDELLAEADDLQRRLDARRAPLTPDKLARTFAALVFREKVGAALRLLDDQGRSAIQSLTPEVRVELERLHPDAEPADPDVLLEGEPPGVPKHLFEGITGESIRRCGLRTTGSGGISGGDAEHWSVRQALRSSGGTRATSWHRVHGPRIPRGAHCKPGDCPGQEPRHSTGGHWRGPEAHH
jgi:hypothetical protein